MAIDYWEETTDASGSTDDQGGQALDRSFDVVVTTQLDSAYEVIAGLAALVSAGAPRKAFPHPNYPLAYCTKVRATRDREHPLLWHVVADYQEPKPEPGQDPQQPTKPPEEQPPTINTDTDPTEVYDIMDWAGEKILNTAGDGFDPPVVTFQGVTTIAVRRKYLAVNIPVWEDYVQTTNDAPIVTPIGTFPKNSLLLAKITTSPKTERSRTFREVTFILRYKKLPPTSQQPKAGKPFFPQTGAWLPTAVLNAGYSYLKGGKRLTTFDDAGKVPLNHPVLLAEDGTRLPDGAAPIYKHFQQYVEKQLGWIFV